MEVQTPEPRRGEHVRWQDSSVGDHQPDVRLELAQPRGKLSGSHLFRLINEQSELARLDLHGRLVELQSAASWPIRLRDYPHDLRHSGEREQRRYGDRRSSEENSAHRPAYSAPSAGRKALDAWVCGCDISAWLVVSQDGFLVALCTGVVTFSQTRHLRRC